MSKRNQDEWLRLKSQLEIANSELLKVQRKLSIEELAEVQKAYDDIPFGYEDLVLAIGENAAQDLMKLAKS